MQNQSSNPTPSSKRFREPKASIGPRSLLWLLAAPARRIRDQAEKEARARLIAHFAGIDQGAADAPLGVMRRQPAYKPVRVRPGEPLEQLWELPARQPPGAR
jgi:hypothetical protein